MGLALRDELTEPVEAAYMVSSLLNTLRIPYLVIETFRRNNQHYESSHIFHSDLTRSYRHIKPDLFS